MASLPRCRASKVTATMRQNRFPSIYVSSTFRCSNVPSSSHRHLGLFALSNPSPSYSASGRDNYSRTTTSILARRMTTTKIIPRKAALALTPKMRNIFKQLLEATGSQGIILKYEISSQHALRMAFKFDFIKDAMKELSGQDEG